MSSTKSDTPPSGNWLERLMAQREGRVSLEDWRFSEARYAAHGVPFPTPEDRRRLDDFRAGLKI